jgi:hypothetical protein
MNKGLLVIAIGGAVVCSHWVARRVLDKTHRVADQWLSEASIEKRAVSLCLKSEFQEAEIKPARVVDNHTHGVSAATRSSATLLIQRIAGGVGRKAFFYQGSGADSRSGRAYSRRYFWAKDLMAPSSHEEPGPRDLLAFVDVDYYVNMPEFLAREVRPYLIYTFVPSRAAKEGGDYGFCFDEKNNVVYHVSGGGRYGHPLWNWDGDSLRVLKTWWGIIPYGIACYQIERRQMDEDHQLILLVPLFESTGILSALVGWWKLSAAWLKRFIPCKAGFVRFYVNKSDGLFVATGKPMCYTDSLVRARVDDTIASVRNTISGKLTLASVKSKLDDGDCIDVKKHAGAEVLLEFHLARGVTSEFISLVDAVRRFQWIPKGAELDNDAKPGMVAFMSPILNGAFVPDVCKGNEERFVSKRMRDIKSEELVMDSFMLKCMEEFAQFLIPDDQVHKLLPVDYEVVRERQSKPSQVAILNEADHSKPTNVTKQFMKKEAYPNVNDPRGISTINGYDKREFSRYMYSFVDGVLKSQPWYAFGKTPVEVAHRVAEVCSKVRAAYLKDFSRMDGRHSNVLHYLEKYCYCRAFHESVHEHLIEMVNKHHHLRARTTFGIRLMTEFQRLSGGADTSGANTLDTAFVAYLAYRMMWIEAAQAWSMLGIYGGDDGLDGDVDPEVASKAALRVGQVLEVDEIIRGAPGVMFLARRYGPDVWYGDVNSCCDIKRQVAKLHTTVQLVGKVTKEQKLQEKAYSFFLTDANTPIVGPFVKKALELFPMKKPFENALGIWGVEEDAEKQYPNEYGDWMQTYANECMADFDLERFAEWVKNCTATTIFTAPRFAEDIVAAPKPGAVGVDEDLLVVEEKTPSAPKTETTSAKVSGKPVFRPRKPKDERPSRNPGKNPKST